MLVAVREFLPDETRRLCGSQDESLEVRYTINIKDNELTITDAADPRCCQILKCDFYFSTSGLLFDSAVAPIVRLALQDFGSAKAIVVVDGAETVRHHTLFDPIEGVLARSWRLLVDWAVGLCGVTLENIFLNIVELRGNTMLKDLSLGGTRHGFKGKGVIARELWDSHSAGDLLASLECAPYYDVKCEGDLRMALHRVSHVVSSDYSQVFSLVLQYRTPTQRYSTTLRFMSLAMADEERAGPSTRHCVVTAAQLISCCALNKAGVSTAFSSLVEPGLLGQCPALWISCFAPSAPTFAAFPGSFTESYRVATTASHVYESRRGVRGHRSSQQVASFPSSRKKKTMNSTSNLYSEVDATHCVKKKHSARASSRARQTESRNSCHAEAKISDCATKTCAGFFSQTVYNCAGPEAAPGVRAGEAANGSHPTVQPGKGSGGCDNGGTSHAPCHRRTKARPQCPFEANQRAMWLQLFNHLQRELNRYEKREDAYRHCIEVLKWALSSFETGTTGPKGRVSEHLQKISSEGREHAVGTSARCSDVECFRNIDQLRKEIHEIRTSCAVRDLMLESYRADLQHEIKRRENIEEEVRQSLASCTAAVDEAIRTALISTWKEGCMEPPPQPRSPSPGIRQQVVFSVIHSPPRDPCGNTQRINTRRRQLCGVLSPACDPPACPAETNGGSVSLYV